MKLHLVTTVPQVDGSARYILMTSARAAREWAAEIDINPSMIDAGTPDYMVDRHPDGRLTADIYPSRRMAPEQWQAVRAAIKDRRLP